MPVTLTRQLFASDTKHLYASDHPKAAGASATELLDKASATAPFFSFSFSSSLAKGGEVAKVWQELVRTCVFCTQSLA